jgi:hypothetical protein
MTRVKKKFQALNAMKRNVGSFIEEESIRKKAHEKETYILEAMEYQSRKHNSIFRQGIEFVGRKAISSYKKFWGVQVAPP